MSAHRSCIRAVHVGFPRKVGFLHSRFLSNTAVFNTSSREVNVSQLLATPSWSISSLLPIEASSSTPSITSTQLRHLLRLSALPPPQDEAEEKAMLATLSSQLHFVRQIQEVDTTGVDPLQSLRDETKKGESEAELGLDALKKALGEEEVKGKFHRRIRRKAETSDQGEQWDILGNATRKAGRYFVVEGGKDK